MNLEEAKLLKPGDRVRFLRDRAEEAKAGDVWTVDRIERDAVVFRERHREAWIIDYQGHETWPSVERIPAEPAPALPDPKNPKVGQVFHVEHPTSPHFVVVTEVGPRLIDMEWLHCDGTPFPHRHFAWGVDDFKQYMVPHKPHDGCRAPVTPTAASRPLPKSEPPPAPKTPHRPDPYLKGRCGACSLDAMERVIVPACKPNPEAVALVREVAEREASVLTLMRDQSRLVLSIPAQPRNPGVEIHPAGRAHTGAGGLACGLVGK